MATNRELQILVKARDEASKVINNVSGSINSAQDASKKFAIGVAGAAVAIGGLGMKAIQAASDAEQSQVAFSTMLGSDEQAQEFIAKMKEFAAKTPFETSDIAKASQTFLAFGMDVKDVMPSVQMIGDVAMGNKEKFASLSLAFAQVQSTGKLMGQDLLQMVNQGFNPLQIISEKTGKSMAQLKEEMSKGQISAQDVADAFKTATSEGGRFYGGMEAQSKTLAGVWSTLKDTFNELLIDIGTGIIPVAKGFVDALNTIISKTKEIITWFQEHQSVIYIVAGAIVGALVPALISWATTLWTSVLPAIAAATIALAPYIIGGAIIGGIVAGIVWIIKNWEMLSSKAIEIFQLIANFFSNILNSIKSVVENVWNGIKSFLEGVWNVIKGIFNFALAFILGVVIGIFKLMGIDIIAVFEQIKIYIQLAWEFIKMIFTTALDVIKLGWETIWTAISTFFIGIWENIKLVVSTAWNFMTTLFQKASEPLKKAWTSIWDGIKNTVDSIWEGIKASIKGGINWIIDKINFFIRAANKIASAGNVIPGVSIPQIPEIPKLAKGGVVNRPTLAMIGEAGPEAVVPLNKRNNPMYGQGGLTIIVNGDVSGDELIEKVGEGIMNKLRMNTQGALSF